MPFFHPRLLILVLLLLTACASQAVTEAPRPEKPPVTAAPAAQEAPTEVLPTDTPLTQATAVPTATGTPDEPEVCSPVIGYPVDSIEPFITNPFRPPKPGSDDPHQGIDIADFLPGTRTAIEGRGVQAVLSGRVAGVLGGDFPFGFGLIVETDPAWLHSVPDLPTPFPETPLFTTLTCPGVTRFEYDPEKTVIYVLYAHLEGPVEKNLGDTVACGEQIGTIGDSGNALNPHLHLEARVGPAGLRIGGMSHYDASATTAEMDAYCLWRVSGVFRLMDPRDLLSVGR